MVLGLGKYILAGSGVIIAGLLVTMHFKNNRIESLEDEINNPVTGYIARMAVKDRDITSLQDAITRQNAEIDGLRTASAERAAAASEAIEAIREQAATELARARAIELNPPDVGVCEPLDDLFLPQL